MSFSDEDSASTNAGTFNQTVNSAQSTAQGQQGVTTQQTTALPAGLSEQSLQELATAYGVSQVQMADMLSRATAGVGVAPSQGQQDIANQINNQGLTSLRDRAAGGNVISPEAQAQIDRAFGAADALGQRDINMNATNDANARGLAVTDSPVANAKAIALADFKARLESQKAGATLDYGSREADRATSFDMYQKELQQRAYQNRLALLGTSPAAYGLQSNLFNQRLAQGRTTGSTNNVLQGATQNTGGQSGSSTGLFTGSQTGYGLSAQGAGSLLSGAGAALKGAGEAGLFD